jgi:hypothetical protein
LIELAAVLQDMANELTRLGFRFALVGGLAVSIRGQPRFTNDADLAVAVGADAEAERLSRELQSRGYQLLAQLEHRDTALRGHLIAMKVLSASDKRPLDRADLLYLIQRSDDADLRLARSSLETVQARGCDSARDLQAEFAEHLRLARLPPDSPFIPRAAPPTPPP